MKKETPEATVTKSCLTVAALNGFHGHRQQSGFFNGRVKIGTNGDPDWEFTRPIEPGVAEIFYAEFKAPGKIVSDEQIRERLSRCKGKMGKDLKRMVDQKARQEELRHMGYLVTVKDDSGDFREWMRTNFKGIR